MNFLASRTDHAKLRRMNLLGRLFLLFFKRCFSRKNRDLFEACQTRFVVNPLDLDINLHMNNGRYLSIMDLGRVDLMLRSGVFWKLIRGGYYPVVVSESIRFKKSLGLLQGFELVTRIEAWDEKDFYIRQAFVRHGEIVAEGYIKGRFKQRGRQGSVPTEETFRIAGKTMPLRQVSDLSVLQKAIEEKLIVK